jgi:hypothetical protein
MTTTTDLAASTAQLYNLLTRLRAEPAPSPDGEILRDLKEYFPGAVTTHDCYRAIERLEEDLAILVMRLMGEDDSTHAPETRDVMHRRGQWAYDHFEMGAQK